MSPVQRRSLVADLRLYATLLGWSERELEEVLAESSTLDKKLLRDDLRREYLEYGARPQGAKELTGLEQIDFWTPKLEDEDRLVYFVQSGDVGPVKIGIARDPLARLGELQTGNPEQLHIRHVLPGDRTMESGLHHRFREARIRGEWFGLAYLDLILVFAAGLAEEHLRTGRRSGAKGVEVATQGGLVVEPQADLDRTREELEHYWKRGHSIQEMAQFTDLEEGEVCRQLDFMVRSSEFAVTQRQPKKWGRLSAARVG
jgi:hypothetical protein